MNWSSKIVPADTMSLTDVEVTRGRENPIDADIAVIVMAIDTDPRALAAVRSVIDQSVAAEIVLVNTGAGSFAPLLPPQLKRRLTLVESSRRRFPGGTRNLGVAHSTAPIVAFLAADCVAQPDWLDARVTAHERGYDLVASSLSPNVDDHGAIPSASWASYVLTHLHRAPGSEPEAGDLLFGLSYRRKVLERHGPFDETVRVSEDLQFNRMLKNKGYRVRWDPAIVTLHDYPRDFRSALIDQVRRGRISAQYASAKRNIGLPRYLRYSWCRHRRRLAAARTARDDLDFDNTAAVLGMLRLLQFAHALGALSSKLAAREGRIHWRKRS